MVKAIAFANHKGGVGNTTSAVNIASCFAETGKEELAVDLHLQGSASLHFGVYDSGEAFLHAIEKAVGLSVVRTPVGRVDLVPSEPALADAVQRFSGTLGMELLGRCLARTFGDWKIAVIEWESSPISPDTWTKLGQLGFNPSLRQEIKAELIGLST